MKVLRDSDVWMYGGKDRLYVSVKTLREVVTDLLKNPDDIVCSSGELLWKEKTIRKMFKVVL